MKKTELKQIIREEIRKVLSEGRIGTPEELKQYLAENKLLNEIQDSEEYGMSDIKPGDQFEDDRGEIYTVEQIRGNFEEGIEIDFSYDDGMSFGDDTSMGEATFPEDFPNVGFFDLFTPIINGILKIK